jgi:hypothetical protein
MDKILFLRENLSVKEKKGAKGGTCMYMYMYVYVYPFVYTNTYIYINICI